MEAPWKQRCKMAKKPTAKDRHKSGFMVRLPEKYRELMAKLRMKNRRTITTEVQIALDEHLKREGIKSDTIN